MTRKLPDCLPALLCCPRTQKRCSARSGRVRPASSPTLIHPTRESHKEIPMNCPTFDRNAAIKPRSKQFCQSSQKCKGLVGSRMFGHRSRPATDMAHVRYVATLLSRGRRIAGHPDKSHDNCCHVGKGLYPKAHHLAALPLRWGHPGSRRWQGEHGKQAQHTVVCSKGHTQTTGNIAAVRRALEGQR